MARKRRKNTTQTGMLKKLISVLPGWILTLIILTGLCFGVLVESGAVELSRVQQLLGFTVFDDENAASEDIKLTEELKRFAVYTIDVGQGDSTLINANGAYVLIDAGEEEYGETVCAFLRGKNVKKLDFIIATHPHSDHIGGLDEVIDEFGADTVIVPKLDDDMVPSTVCYERFLKAVKNSGTKLTAAKQGKAYELGSLDGQPITMTVLGPCTDEVYDDLNDYSVPVRIDCGSTSMLFTGDMTERSEHDLIESDADIDVTFLSVAHHGSNGSSCGDFLAAVSPKICVISCGADNSYGHPGEKTLRRLSEYSDRIYRTDINGTVAVYSDGSKMYVNLEKREE